MTPLLAVATAHHHREALHRHCAKAQRVAEMNGDFFELHHALRVGLLMDAEHHRQVERFHAPRHRLIRRQHELFDQLVGLIARRAAHTRHLARVVELNQRLRQIEIDRPSPHALLVQDLCEFEHQFKARHQRLVTFPLFDVR